GRPPRCCCCNRRRIWRLAVSCTSPCSCAASMYARRSAGVRRLIAFCTATGFGFEATGSSFLIAAASSGFCRSIAFVDTLAKKRRMKPIRDSDLISGFRSAPFRNRPRTIRSRNNTRTTPMRISGRYSHHIGPMVLGRQRRAAQRREVSARPQATSALATSAAQIHQAMPDEGGCAGGAGWIFTPERFRWGMTWGFSGCKDSLNVGGARARYGWGRHGKRRGMTADPIALLLEHGDEHGCVHLTELHELVQKLELEEEEVDGLIERLETH